VSKLATNLRQNSDFLLRCWLASMSGNIFDDSARDNDRILIIGAEDEIGGTIASSMGIAMKQGGVGNICAGSMEY
jgi:hypothetical protein